MPEHTKEDLLKLAKKYSNKKTILSTLSFVLVLAVSILSSVPEFIIDPAQILTAKFLTKLIMSLIIGITSLICFMLIGSNANALNELSEIYKARESFRNSVPKVLEKYGAFKQWLERKRRPQKQKEVDERILRHAGITNLNYLKLELNEIRDLVKAPNKELAKQYGIRQITQEQCDLIINIRNGAYSIQFLNVNDYLYERTMGIDETDEEMLVKQYKKRTLMFTEAISSKVLISIVVSVVLGAIGWSTLENIGGDMSVAQRTFTIIWDILTKLTTAIISAMMGFFDGGRFNDFDARYLQVKTNIHTQFLNDTEFKVKSESELAMEEFIKYHEEQNTKERLRLGFDPNNTPNPESEK